MALVSQDISWGHTSTTDQCAKFMNVIGPFAKKLENLLFSKNVVIG